MVIQKIDNKAAIKKLLNKGENFLAPGKYDSALFYFNKALILCNPKAEYADDYVTSLVDIADVQQRYGDYYEAETTLTKALPYLDKTTMPKHAINVYSLMANNYYSTYDQVNALIYEKKALKKAISSFRKAGIITNIAFIYIQQKKHREAINLLRPLSKRKIRDKIDPPNTDVQHAAILYYLGLCYLRIENHKELALNCFNESLELTIKTNNDYELIANYYALYLYYKKYNNPELELINARKAYDCAKTVKSSTNTINMLANLIRVDNAKNSRKHWEVYLRLSDSVTMSRKKAKNQFAKSIYDSQKDKEENLELKSRKAENEVQLERQKNRSFISYILISVSIISLVFLAFYIITKGKREKNDIVLKSEMRISSKLQDELSKKVYQAFHFAENNDLNTIENKEKLLSSLNDIYTKTRNISKENSQILTDERYVLGLKEMISEYKTQNINILLNGFDAVLWNTFDKNIKIVLYRILQELFQNMKNHSNANLVSVAVKSHNKILNLTYTDNGEGIRTNKIIFKKGLKNVEDRIKSVNGQIDICALDHGFKVFIKLPI